VPPLDQESDTDADIGRRRGNRLLTPFS